MTTFSRGTEQVVREIVRKAREMHAEASDPQEDQCEALADWIEGRYLNIPEVSVEPIYGRREVVTYPWPDGPQFHDPNAVFARMVQSIPGWPFTPDRITLDESRRCQCGAPAGTVRYRSIVNGESWETSYMGCSDVLMGTARGGIVVHFFKGEELLVRVEQS